MCLRILIGLSFRPVGEPARSVLSSATSREKEASRAFVRSERGRSVVDEKERNAVNKPFGTVVFLRALYGAKRKFATKQPSTAHTHAPLPQ